ncbi:MAG: 5-formyltetrahydrofolate cyclo-ligase, partial [Acidimicrobiia bacterium]
VLFSWLSARLPGTGAAYLAMSDEVEVTPLFNRLPGWRWVLPRIEDDGILTFRDRDVARETHRWGMTQPSDQGRIVPVHEIDVFLVPGLAFDHSGRRLGRGGGYYDRVLAGRRADSVAIGVTVTARIIDTVPVVGHDQRVDWLAIEDGVILTRPNR